MFNSHREAASNRVNIKLEIMKKFITLMFFAVKVVGTVAQSCDPIDHGFGVNGKATGFSTTNEWINGGNILVQRDNKVIQISSISTSFNVVRYTIDGQLDQTFGNNGIATFNAGSNNYGYASFGTLQNDGKIVVVGRRYTNSNYYTDITLVRFNSDGSVDDSFGTGGVVVTGDMSYHDEGYGLAVQPDGKIVVAGLISNSCFNDCFGNRFCMPSMAVVRYNSNGTLDATFGQNGVSLIPNSDSLTGGRGRHVVIQADGKIVAVGDLVQYYCDWYYGGSYNFSGLLMARFDSQGKI